jgi:hypothetical protein
MPQHGSANKLWKLPIVERKLAYQAHWEFRRLGEIAPAVLARAISR